MYTYIQFFCESGSFSTPTNLIDMEEVFNLVSTLFFCIQEAELTDKVIDLLPIPTFCIHSQCLGPIL